MQTDLTSMKTGHRVSETIRNGVERRRRNGTERIFSSFPPPPPPRPFGSKRRPKYIAQADLYERIKKYNFLLLSGPAKGGGNCTPAPFLGGGLERDGRRRRRAPQWTAQPHWRSPEQDKGVERITQGGGELGHIQGKIKNQYWATSSSSGGASWHRRHHGAVQHYIQLARLSTFILFYFFPPQSGGRLAPASLSISAQAMAGQWGHDIPWQHQPPHPFLPTRSLYNRYLSLKAFLSCSSSLLDWSSSLSGHYLLASGSVTQKKKENLFSSCRAESNSGRYRSHDFPTVRGCDGQQNVVYIYIYVYVYRSKQPSTQPKSG